MRSNQIAFRLLLLSVAIACLFAGNVATTHAASVPVLVKDINTQIKDDSSIGDLVAVGSTLYFTAFDRAHGVELWKSDGTAAGTAMVKDIRPGPTGSAWAGGKFLTYWNGLVYFKAYGPNGWSLWKSDGTSANTVEVSHKADPSNIVVFKGALYFCRSSFGLWKSDGTDAGTVAVKEGIGTFMELVVAGSGPDERLYFTQGNNLWTSDGTTDGTVILQSGISPAKLTVVGSTLFFRGWDSAHGYELWRSDGTVVGTAMVQDINPGTASSFPGAASYLMGNLVNMNGVLYFQANDPTNLSSLWKCTTSGVPDLVKSNNSPSNLFPIGSTLYFRSGTGLWKSDGTTANTVQVKPGVNPDIRMANVDGTLFFRGADATHGNELWKSDGTTAGTVMVKDINPVGSGASDPDNLTNMNGMLYFTATEPATGTQLWKSDGSEAGTVLVQNVSPGSRDALPANLMDVNGILYFAANDTTNGVKLWQSNGTAAATVMVPGFTGINPVPLVNANGTLFFTANSEHLWKRVSANSAELVMASISINDPTKSIYIGGTLYFRGADSAHGYELWKSDGTTTGTVIVKDINPGAGTSAISNLTNLNGVLYFIASNGVDTLLWTSDGSDAGTVPIRSDDIKQVRDLTLVNGKLFFLADDPDNPNSGVDLWVSDGTPAGSSLLAKEHNAVNLTAVGSTLFYNVGTLVWKSDGVTITQVADFGGNIGYGVPINFTNVNGTLYFAIKHAVGSDHFIEIWKSNGVPAGTSMVKSFLNPNYNLDLTSMKFTSVHGLLAFVYDDGVHGEELWTCNGTDAGTTMVKDIYSDPSGFGSSPANLTMANTPPNGVANEALFFSAIDQLAGRELYILDFTPPLSAITVPANNAYIRGTTYNIAGTSSDSMPGTGVNLVEVSTDGATWHSATDTSAGIPWVTWQYTWTLPVDGVYTIRSRSTDLATNVQTPLASITVTVDNTKPIVTLAAPAVFHPSALPAGMAITFTATDLNGIASYCLTPTLCQPNIHRPTSYTFYSEGNITLFAWAQDPAGNVSDQASATTLVALPHTLTIDLAGDGKGSVSFQQKSATYNVDTVVSPVYSFDQVTLQATPSEYSLFGGWSGICTGTDCNYTMPTVAAAGAAQTATATFSYDGGHAVYVAPRYFDTILGAYQADTTVNGNQIRMFGTIFDEILLLDRGKAVTLTGGDHQNHAPASTGMTTVPGPLTVQSGAVTIEKLVIK